MTKSESMDTIWCNYVMSRFHDKGIKSEDVGFICAFLNGSREDT